VKQYGTRRGRQAIASQQRQDGLTPKRTTFDDRAFDYIPWAQPLRDPRKSQITVKQLLNHTSEMTQCKKVF
jgi:hypothetical protein